MNYRRSFDARDFRWAGPETAGCRSLEYIGLPVTIRIPMHRRATGGDYSVGEIAEPDFRPTDHDAFERCGGLHGLEDAARWFANSR